MSELKKVSLKDAKYAHVTREKIKIVCRKKIQGVTAEYTIEVPNETIKFDLYRKNTSEPKSFYFSEYSVKFLKDVLRLSYYENNSSVNATEAGVRMESVILHTKKGDISHNRFHMLNNVFGCPDVQAVYH